MKQTGNFKYATVFLDGDVSISNAKTPRQHSNAVSKDLHGENHRCKVVHEHYDEFPTEEGFERYVRVCSFLRDRGFTII